MRLKLNTEFPNIPKNENGSQTLKIPYGAFATTLRLCRFLWGYALRVSKPPWSAKNQSRLERKLRGVQCNMRLTTGRRNTVSNAALKREIPVAR